ncbi:hypothetical protein K474DRAFT_1713175 [Panus rudis PR-1116 ss-1]|nr:hypothetical protein K474DRAFT_1713175 [Panus rudis PR-1116 ss-1]
MAYINSIKSPDVFVLHTHVVAPLATTQGLLSPFVPSNASDTPHGSEDAGMVADTDSETVTEGSLMGDDEDEWISVRSATPESMPSLTNSVDLQWSADDFQDDSDADSDISQDDPRHRVHDADKTPDVVFRLAQRKRELLKKVAAAHHSMGEMYEKLGDIEVNQALQVCTGFWHRNNQEEHIACPNAGSLGDTYHDEFLATAKLSGRVTEIIPDVPAHELPPLGGTSRGIRSYNYPEFVSGSSSDGGAKVEEYEAAHSTRGGGRKGKGKGRMSKPYAK